MKSYINNPAAYYFFKVNDVWLAINQQHKESMNLLQHHLYLKKSGSGVLAKLRAGLLIPDHELALSVIINKNTVLQTPNWSTDQAIQYLRRDNLILETNRKRLELNDL